MSKAEELFKLADEVAQKKANAKEAKAQARSQACIDACTQKAKEGFKELQYTGDLCIRAREILLSEGFKIRDDGGGVASSYKISWDL